jgi:hypothetical protein
MKNLMLLFVICELTVAAVCAKKVFFDQTLTIAMGGLAFVLSTVVVAFSLWIGKALRKSTGFEKQ